ncbi:hypothetical protein [Paracoccus aminovorans]|uniref:hypothetical protein n=1 Tax=Paracoccus aminovorans TaxID=34004 RepID=UPI000785316F|nr:hypothetical protein [Paracoccus aminovorans]
MAVMVQSGLDMAGVATARWRVVGFAQSGSMQMDAVQDDRIYLAPSLTSPANRPRPSNTRSG